MVDSVVRPLVDVPVHRGMIDLTRTPQVVWSVTAERSITFAAPLVMGILNATPDSFHDGRSDYRDREVMVRAGSRMVDEGADIIDVGGESSRPGSHRVDPAEQCERTTKIIQKLGEQRGCLISIDTTHASVASKALDAGAHIVNDVSAGMEDPALLPMVAARGCGVILMHRLAPPGDDVYSDQYRTVPDYGSAGVVAGVAEFLLARLDAAKQAGVACEQVVFDPGFGFGKSVEQNLELLRGLPELSAMLGRPLLIGASRKSFIGSILDDRPPEGRLYGSLAVATLAARSGASIVRCHDVRPTRDTLELVAAFERPAGGSGGTIDRP